MAKPKVYTHDEKMVVALTYLMEGSAKATAKKTGVPRTTIRDWMTTEWWPEYYQDAKNLKNVELDSLYTQIIHKGIGELSDRLDNGDEVILKDGSKTRKKMNGKECAWTAAVMADKRTILRGDPTRITKNTSVSDNLKDFQKALEDVGKKRESQVIGEVAKEIEEDIVRH